MWWFGFTMAMPVNWAKRRLQEYRKWVRDPFDRLIVAQAIANEAPLVTKDEKIRRHYRRAVW